MARGWESKEVESQIEAAETRRANLRKPELAPDQIRRQRERESLESSRTRVLADLMRATHPRHKAQLEAALAFLNEKLSHLTNGE